VGEESLGEGGRYPRSEGLALASFDAFAAGLFSSSKADPFRCDASALMALEEKELAAAFQVSPENPLVGIEGRVALLRTLGVVMAGDDIHFDSESPRIGDLFDFLLTQKDGMELSARTILITVLEALGPIWPGRIALGGINLGDTWRHSAIKRDDPTNGLIPFHKLSQWLSYSLFEPLEWAGLKIRDPGHLTGLAEYRNGGLFIDLGIIQPKDPRILQDVFRPEDERIVEWRALTIALLDLVAPMVRAELGLHEDDFPLAKVLEGGTWAAGRRIAGERREGGGPPISIESDGAVF
jgi:hypothetical protein